MLIRWSLATLAAAMVFSGPFGSLDPTPIPTPSDSAGVSCGPLGGCKGRAASGPTGPTGSSGQGNWQAATNGNSSPAGKGASDGDSNGTAEPVANETPDPYAAVRGFCYTTPVAPQPAAGDPVWGGGSPATGVVVHQVCQSGAGAKPAPPYFQANDAPAVDGGAPAVVQISAGELAQEMVKDIPIPEPVIHVGPASPDQVAVKVPVAMWVDQQVVAPVTATAGAVSVTATPRLQSVSWSMGDPVDPSNPGVLADPVVCSGSAMYVKPAGSDPAYWPCRYTYIWKSTAARTGGTEKWPISATATWVIDWTATTGESGAITAPPAVTEAEQRVGQWTAIGVPAPVGG